ncbi:MAG: nitronate monooxygenase [Pararhodobacter sp.]|nr:nitronate monooxygenase [Pararhodobacter sp.]
MPVLMAPMAGTSPPALAAAVANAGGMGACGALPLSASAIAEWVARFRQQSAGAFQINLWVPDAPAARDAGGEAAQARFLASFGPEPTPPDNGPLLEDFDAQFAALLQAAPPVASTIMGLFRSDQVSALKARGISWFATATTLDEARAAQAAGAEAIIAQGAEAGGHRGCFAPGDAPRASVGTLALVPAIADAVSVPVIAAGGIGDGRGVAAVLALGASAAMIGTALLRTPEADITPAWADALARARPEDTTLTRAFSGRTARALRNAFTEAADHPAAPPPAPYPVQRHLTDPMRRAAIEAQNFDHLYALSGQAAALARTDPAGETVARFWQDARRLLA